VLLSVCLSVCCAWSECHSSIVRLCSSLDRRRTTTRVAVITTGRQQLSAATPCAGRSGRAGASRWCPWRHGEERRGEGTTMPWRRRSPARADEKCDFNGARLFDRVIISRLAGNRPTRACAAQSRRRSLT